MVELAMVVVVVCIVLAIEAGEGARTTCLHNDHDHHYHHPNHNQTFKSVRKSGVQPMPAKSAKPKLSKTKQCVESLEPWRIKE